MIVTPEFPEHRLQDPRRQAEWRVYQEIAGSQAPGRALYEMRAGLHAPQLDFGIWLQDVAHYGLQVKGGETATAGGEWRLHSANGPETIPSPIAQTFDAAIAIRDIIKAQLHRKVFICPAQPAALTTIPRWQPLAAQHRWAGTTPRPPLECLRKPPESPADALMTSAAQRRHPCGGNGLKSTLRGFSNGFSLR